MDRTKASDAFNAGSIPVGCIFVKKAGLMSDKETTTNLEEQMEEHPLEGLEAVDLGDDSKDKGKTKKKDAGFGKAMQEVFVSIGGFFKNHKQMIFVLLAGIVLIVAASLVAVFVTKNNMAKRDEAVSDNAANDGSTALYVPIDPLMENAYPEVNELISTYFTAVQNDDKQTIVTLRKYLDTVEAVKFDVKSHYVESYQNIICYTKKGPFEDSYIVYVTADVKMKEWDTLAPSLQTILVCTDEAGTLYIYSGAFDENIANYIKEISSQPDVAELITRIDTTYREVMDADPAFATYMESLNQIIKDEVTEVLATQSIVISEVETGEVLEVVETGTVSENEVESDADDEKEYEAIAITQVNVRASDSPEADTIGKLTGGQEVHCYENLPNGWSRIAYDDGDGYVKTEFLARAGLTEEDATSVRTALDMINVRGTDSSDGNLMGTMQKGETVYVLEDLSNGWTKIIYKGAEAYVKTEFIE